MSDKTTSRDLTMLTANVVSAYLANNNLPIRDLPNFIRQIYLALMNLGVSVEEVSEKPIPAVPIKKSIMPDYIICLEDGQKLKMLKRHLKASFNLTPEQYRERWDLPADYPMVAPNYATQRSSLAKKIGLGTRSRRRPKK